MNNATRLIDANNISFAYLKCEYSASFSTNHFHIILFKQMSFDLKQFGLYVGWSVASRVCSEPDDKWRQHGILVSAFELK